MKYEYKSQLGCEMEAFLDFKHKQGFVYNSQACLLRELDGYLALNHPHETTISRDWAQKWIYPRRSTERPGTTNKRITLLRELGNFISITDPSCYVIENDFNLRDMQPQCRIITPKEMQLLLSKIKDLNPRGHVPGILHSTVRIGFTLMYLTGMRSGEVRNLRKVDVLQEKKALRIRESKGHVNRLIVLSDELFDLVESHLKQTQINSCEYLLSLNGVSSISSDSFNLILKRLWKMAELPNPPPHMSDFRHSFITLRILQWHKEGVDVSLKAQYLQAFVGHNRLEDTLYYFRLVPEIFNVPHGKSDEQ